MSPKHTIHTIRMGVVNAFLLVGDKTIIIDTGYPGSTSRILKSLDREGIDHSNVSLILLTHYHPDHSGSAVELRKILNVPIAIHKSEAQGLRTGITPATPVSGVGRFFSMFISERKSPACEPDILVDDEQSLQAFGVNASILHTPGHSPGSVSILTSEGEAIVGDLVFGGRLNTRRPVDPMFADDLELVRESITKLLSFNPRIIYAGHGGPFNPKDIIKKFSV